MKQVTFKMEGISPFSQSRPIQSVKSDRITHADFENKVWRERMHVDDNGLVTMPPMMVKNMLSDCAKFISMKVPGGKGAAYTKHFEAGIMCMEHCNVLDAKGKPIKAADVPCETLFVPASGKRGDGKRVNKNFPKLATGWNTTPTIYVLDPMITPDVLKHHLIRAGQFIGVGRFRPRNNGFYGRFKVSNIVWTTVSDELDEAA